MTFPIRFGIVPESISQGEYEMKKLYVMLTVFVISLTVGVTAMAQTRKGLKESQKHCSSCNKSAATPETLKKFKADTIDLRQEMMNKRFDLQRENLKETPDSARIAAIKSEMEAIKVKIDAIRTAANLPKSACCSMEDCPLMDDNCDKCKTGKTCDTKGKKTAGCSKCNKETAGCGCKECADKGNCGNCKKAADCSCNKKGKRK
jgi:hypothetical protein